MFGFSKNNSQEKIDGLENEKEILERRFKTVEQIVNTMPLGVITLEKQTGYFVYINDTSMKILKDIGHPLSLKNIDNPKEVHISDFIPKAELDHAIIKKETSFPLNKVIQIGNDFIDVEFNPLNQGNGGIERLMLTWRLVTERETYKKESNKLNQVLNKLPETVFMIDPETLKFTYLNESAHKSLKQLRSNIQINVDKPVGESILNLIKTPGAEQSIRTGEGLPVSRRIQYGDQDLNINLSPVTDLDGKYLTTVLNWNIVTAQVNVERIVAETVESIKKHSEVLNAQSHSMSAAADSNLSTANAVTLAAQLASSNVESVAAGTEELGASVQSIGDQISHSSIISKQANERAQEASKQVEELANASQKIGDVVKLINDIAEQTNLLALNATIEAARAGEAGRGFAVVASEVKSLATQTATATHEITAQIEAIQSETQNMVEAMTDISSVINEVNNIASEISISAEQQSQATREIAGNAQKAADGTQDVSSHIIEVQNVANSNKVGIQQVLDVSIELGGQADKLDAEIKNLMR